MLVAWKNEIELEQTATESEVFMYLRGAGKRAPER
jgi:hypothetical protein